MGKTLQAPCQCCLLLGLCIAGWALLEHSAAASEAIRQGIQVCMLQIVPSLYGFLILTGILLRMGLHQKLGRLFRPFALHLLHMTQGEFAVFLCSQLGGYPVGVQMLSDLVRQGEIPPRRAARLAGVCFGSGPAFVLSLVGTALYPGVPGGSLLFCCGMGANLILAVIFRPEKPDSPGAAPVPAMPLSLAVVSATRSAASSLCSMCGMILLFRLLLAPVPALLPDGLPESIQTGSLSLLEISWITRMPPMQLTLLPLICGLLSFGGICVFMQLLTAGGSWFPKAGFLGMRLLAALLSAGLCRLAAPFWLRHAAVTVSAGAMRMTRSTTPLLPILLVLMTIMILSQKKLDNRTKPCYNEN